MKEGFVLMNMSKYKRWRELLHRAIAEQQSNREHTLCIHMKWKSTKRRRALIHRMITKQRVKNEQIKKTDLLFGFFECI